MDEIGPQSLPEWDAADYLATPSDQADYLSMVLEDGNEAEIAHALHAIARAQAKKGQDPLLSLPSPSNADAATAILKALSLVKALGLKLHVQPSDAA